MEDENRSLPLEQISTVWGTVEDANRASPEAQRQLLDRYGSAVRRYLLGALRNAEAADDLFQEFFLRLVRGDLSNANPERGRFRYFVKGVLFNLIADYHRRRGRTIPLTADVADRVDPEAQSNADMEFQRGWREQLLARAWSDLEKMERSTGQPFHTVLRLRADQPDLGSGQLAEILSAKLERPSNSAWVRQTLHRAREKFVELLLDGVAQTLEQPVPTTSIAN